MFVGVPGVVGVGRAAAGVFIAEFVFGLAWAALGYQFWRWRPMRPALSLLRWWLIGTGLVLGAVLVWAFAPVLVFGLADGGPRRAGDGHDRPGAQLGARVTQSAAPTMARRASPPFSWRVGGEPFRLIRTS